MHERRAEIQLEERFVLSAKYVDEEGKKNALIQGPLGGKQKAPPRFGVLLLLAKLSCGRYRKHVERITPQCGLIDIKGSRQQTLFSIILSSQNGQKTPFLIEKIPLIFHFFAVFVLIIGKSVVKHSLLFWYAAKNL